MNQDQRQFEPLRQDYLQQKYPGDLSEVLKDLDSPTVSAKTNATGSDVIGYQPVYWGLAVAVLVALTAALLWTLQPGKDAPIARSGETNAATEPAATKTTRLSLFALKKPVRFHPVTSESKKVRRPFWAVARPSKKTTSTNPPAAEALPNTTHPNPRLVKTKKRSHWDTGKLSLSRKAKNSLAKSSTLRRKSRSRKSGTRNPYRSRFQFQPIPYRRS